MSTQAFAYQQDPHGIVTITMDMDGPVNCMNQTFMPLLSEAVARLQNQPGLTGVIIASAKTTFFAGKIHLFGKTLRIM